MPGQWSDVSQNRRKVWNDRLVPLYQDAIEAFHLPPAKEGV
jgi:hypothetical protein